MPLGRRRELFDHPDWIYELKYDGFRALLSIGVERPEYQAFTDPSGGSGRDAFTLAVAHAAGGTLRANFTHHPHRADRAKTSGMTESCPRHPQE